MDPWQSRVIETETVGYLSSYLHKHKTSTFMDVRRSAVI